MQRPTAEEGKLLWDKLTITDRILRPKYCLMDAGLRIYKITKRLGSVRTTALSTNSICFKFTVNKINFVDLEVFVS